MTAHALWCSVLELAVSDAVYGVPKSSMRGDGDRLTFIAEAKSAREFVTTPSKDLGQLCDLAGVDPEAFVYRMKKRLSAAPTPEELADMSWAERNALFQVKPEPKPERVAKPEPKPKDPQAKRNGWRQEAAFAGRKIQLHECDGERLSLNQWAARCGVSHQTLRHRMSKGMTLKEAMTTALPIGRPKCERYFPE